MKKETIIILCAGESKRMRESYPDIPKPLVRFLGTPLLEKTLNNFFDYAKEFVLVVRYKQEMIKEYFGDNFKGVPITYVTQSRVGGGPGVALRDALNAVNTTEHFMLSFSDDVFFKDDIHFCILNADRPTMLTYTVEDTSKFGVVGTKVTDMGEKVTSFVEKPPAGTEPSKQVVVGVYKLPKNIKNYLEEFPQDENGKPEYYITDIINKAMKDFDFFITKATYWLPVNDKEQLLQAERFIQGK